MNKLIVIGYMGNKKCYLNITKEEAIKRYCKSEGGFNIENILKEYSEIEFNVEFGAYNCYPDEEL